MTRRAFRALLDAAAQRGYPFTLEGRHPDGSRDLVRVTSPRDVRQLCAAGPRLIIWTVVSEKAG
jgi:hypothetical protein